MIAEDGIVGRIKACIFDLDGTIINTIEAIAKAGNMTLAELGFAPQPVDAYRYYCGDGSDTMVRRALEASGGATDDNIKAGTVLARRFLRDDPTYGIVPYEGMRELLDELIGKGVRLAVFSNKPDEAAGATVEKCYGPDTFDIIMGQSGRFPLKPDPAGALAVAAGLDARPSECAYIGDTATDMRTGKAAGMLTFGALWGFRDEAELIEGGADILIKEPKDLLEYI